MTDNFESDDIHFDEDGDIVSDAAEDAVTISDTARRSPTAAELRPIAERVAQGVATGSSANGGIVPFPNRLSASTILGALNGDERNKVERLRAHGYSPTVFAYRDAEGRYIRFAVRFDHATERKIPLPLIYCGQSTRGRELYYWSDIPGSRPLYGLELLAYPTDEPVLVVEGEKTAEAARAIFADQVVLAWAGGANAVRRVDMVPLIGRRVVFWPDNDAAGRRAGRLFLARALDAGAASAAFVDVPSNFSQKWDLADELPAGIGNDQLKLMVAAARQVSVEDARAFLQNPRQRAGKRRLLGHAPGYSGVPIEVAKDALNHLDADMGGGEWRRAARCWYYAFGGGGLETFDAWSATGEKYRAGEPASLWEEYAKEDAFSALPLAWLLRKARRFAEDEQKNFQFDPEAMMIAEIENVNENHAVVIRGGKTVVMRETYDPRFERYEVEYLRKTDFVDKHVRSVPLPGENGKEGKSSPLGRLWFGSLRRREFDGIVFMPGRNAGERIVNLWRGFAVDPAYNPAGWSRLKQHLLDHVAQGNSAAFEYILNWLAAGVQWLGRPTGTALVLTGPKGAGKSILIELYGHLFGPHKFVTAHGDDFVGKFNARLEHTLVLGVEEAFAPQNRAADGALKDLITRDTLRLEDKFFSTWMAPNHLRIIMTSNNEHVVRADGSDRRYAVFEVANPHQRAPEARRAYFGAIVEQMESGGYEAMLGELLARDISGWNAEAIPETDALKRQKLLNLGNDPVRSWLHARLTDGVAIVEDRGPGTTERRWNEKDTTEVPVREALTDFIDYVRRNNMRASERNFTMQLPRYMPSGFKSRTARFQTVDGSSTHRVYDFPALKDAREAFVQATGLASWVEAGGAD